VPHSMRLLSANVGVPVPRGCPWPAAIGQHALQAMRGGHAGCKSRLAETKGFGVYLGDAGHPPLTACGNAHVSGKQQPTAREY
jgi:hypothetical protein